MDGYAGVPCSPPSALPSPIGDACNLLRVERNPEPFAGVGRLVLLPVVEALRANLDVHLARSARRNEEDVDWMDELRRDVVRTLDRNGLELRAATAQAQREFAVIPDHPSAVVGPPVEVDVVKDRDSVEPLLAQGRADENVRAPGLVGRERDRQQVAGSRGVQVADVELAVDV